MVWPIEAAASCSERILKAALQPLDQSVALRVVGNGGDVLSADGVAEGAPDGAAKLQASIRGDGCRNTKPGDPRGDESASAVISCCRGQWHCFHPPGGAIYDSKQIFITTCSRQRSNQVQAHMAEVAGGLECVVAARARATLPWTFGS